jgi:uncharacterized protein YbaR (Trm112 family)
MISQELLKILACPKCKGELVITDTGDGLLCYACKLKYLIKDGIPIMIIEEAQKIN